MQGDIKLKIRHAKRGNEKQLDLSGMGLSELPVDITQLTLLESINLSNNKLINLKRIEQLPNLREINASNNQINQLHQELLDMWSIESLSLFGNPIVNSNPQLAQIENNQAALKQALQQYFGIQGNSGLAGSGIQTLAKSPGLQSGVQQSQQFNDNNMLSGQTKKQINQGFNTQSTIGINAQNSYNMSYNSNLGSSGKAGMGGGNLKPYQQNQNSTPSFLNQDSQDEMQLRRKIQLLESENKQLKETAEKQSLSESLKKQTISNDDRNWMSSFGNGAQRPGQVPQINALERPVTASSQNQKVREVQEELKNERREKKKLQDQIENLKNEIQKQNFQAFTSGSKQSTAQNVTASDGRLPPVPGVREITINDIEVGEKIGQGGFSTIHKGKLNGTPVAIKKIFDPRLTDELLQEIQNEIVMQSILRHPNVTMLMGVIPQIPDIYIVFEHVSPGSLFDLLHMKKQTIEITLKQKLQIARDAAVVFEYMHNLGIVHRDIKSHNILINHNFDVKVCDFGLAKFMADLGKGSMQYAGTPTYMAPELFQKRQYDHTVDIFAFGSLLWEILNREVPFDGLDAQDICQRVIKGEKLKDHSIAQIDVRLADIVEQSRSVDPLKRPSFQTINEVLDIVIQNQQ